MNKKGNMTDVQKMVMGVVTIAMVVVIGLIVLGSIKESIGLESVTKNNQSMTLTLNSFTAITDCVPSRTMSILDVWNGSAEGTVVHLLSGNYTVVGNKINLSDAGYSISGSTFNVSYSCNFANAAYNATGDNIENLSGLPSWIGIIIVVMLAFLVLGFWFNKRQ